MKNRHYNNDNWATPPDFLREVEKGYGTFFDPCPWNNDIDLFNGLEVDWKGFNFVNPPFSLKLKTAFVKKGIYEALNGCESLFLLPVSTSTGLFHDWIKQNARKIDFLRGRLRFIGINDKGQFVNYDQIQQVTKETILYEDRELPKYIRSSGQQDLMVVLL
jgi:hypothetical protein